MRGVVCLVAGCLLRQREAGKSRSRPGKRTGIWISFIAYVKGMCGLILLERVTQRGDIVGIGGLFCTSSQHVRNNAVRVKGGSSPCGSLHAISSLLAARSGLPPMRINQSRESISAQTMRADGNNLPTQNQTRAASSAKSYTAARFLAAIAKGREREMER